MPGGEALPLAGRAAGVNIWAAGAGAHPARRCRRSRLAPHRPAPVWTGCATATWSLARSRPEWWNPSEPGSHRQKHNYPLRRSGAVGAHKRHRSDSSAAHRTSGSRHSAHFRSACRRPCMLSVSGTGGLPAESSAQGHVLARGTSGAGSIGRPLPGAHRKRLIGAGWLPPYAGTIAPKHPQELTGMPVSLGPPRRRGGNPGSALLQNAP